jgi:DNA-binding MarR family transcriptional regulator
MTYQTNPTLEVVWSQTDETAAAKAQQHVATKPRRRPTSDLVAAYLFMCPPSHYQRSTVRVIAAETGLSFRDVASALQALERNGRVVRSHYQRDDRRRPVEWRLR